MSKRKAADDHNPDGADGAKKPRTEGAAAALADPSAGTGSIEAARARPDLAPRIAMQTLKLVDAIKATDGSHTQRMQTVADLIKADADRPDWLIDFSLVVEGEESCALFLLLRFFRSFCVNTADTADMQAAKVAAQQMIFKIILPLKQRLLRSFDPATVDAATGNNALHEMCRLISPHRVSGWPFKLAELLIAHRVSVHARNKEGRTPLLQKAAALSRIASAANGLRLLINHGADPNAQDGDGNGLLHLLVQRKAADPLDALFDGDGPGRLNFTLRNSAGQTAADLAASQLMELADSNADSPERRIHRLVATQTAMWVKHAQPAPLDGSPPAMHPTGAAAAADNGDLLNAALDRAQLAPRIALQTIKLVDAIKATEGSFTQRMQPAVDLLKADADRPDSLIDLSLVVEGEKSCVLFELLHFFRDFCVKVADSGDVKAAKAAAQQIIHDHVLPPMQKLLRSFDPATVDAATGNNALHEMCRLFCLHIVGVWDYKLAKTLISHGVSVHARNNQGCTPLLQWAMSSVPDFAASGLRLLLAHGSDLNAQDGDGDGVLHHLVRCKAEARLEELFSGDGVEHVEHTLRNSAGQTAADLAAIQLAELQGDPDSEEDQDEAEEAPRQKAERRARQIHRLMMAQAALWTTHTRPVLLRCLESALPVTDVAKLALGYVDGSGLPFRVAVESESDEEAEPAAGAAAAQS